MIHSSKYIDRKKYILNVIGQEKVMSYYLNIPINFNILVVSPLRNDKHPTCSFWKSPSGTLYFHDFALGKMYSCFSIVMEKYKINFTEAMNKIIEDEEKIKSIYVEEVSKEEIVLDIVYDSWNEDYLKYWKGYGISKSLLEKYLVYPVRTVFRNESLYMRSTKANPIYGYKFSSGTVKLYRPLSPEKSKKWRGNSTAKDIGGLKQLSTKGVIVFITSSLKDVMVLKTLGFPAVCLNAETITSSEIIEPLVKILKSRFDHVVSFMDSDEAGMKSNIFISSRYRCKYISTRSKFKDISDYLKKYGYHKTFKLVKKSLSKQFKITVDVPY